MDQSPGSGCVVFSWFARPLVVPGAALGALPCHDRGLVARRLRLADHAEECCAHEAGEQDPAAGTAPGSRPRRHRERSWRCAASRREAARRARLRRTSCGRSPLAPVQCAAFSADDVRGAQGQQNRPQHHAQDRDQQDHVHAAASSPSPPPSGRWKMPPTTSQPRSARNGSGWGVPSGRVTAGISECQQKKKKHQWPPRSGVLGPARAGVAFGGVVHGTAGEADRDRAVIPHRREPRVPTTIARPRAARRAFAAPRPRAPCGSGPAAPPGLAPQRAVTAGGHDRAGRAGRRGRVRLAVMPSPRSLAGEAAASRPATWRR